MNILLINHYAGSNRHGMEYRPYYLSREWVRSGHPTTVAAASYSHLRIQNPTFRGVEYREEIDGIQYIWWKTPGYQGNGAKRVVNIFSFLYRVQRNLHHFRGEHKPDLVIASSTYPLDIIPAHRIARQTGARLVYEVHDLWPLTLIELGGMSPRHPFVMLLQWAENFAYRCVDRVVSILPNADAHMREHGLAPGKFVHIPNGIDVGEWENGSQPLPELHQQALCEIKRQGAFLVGYAGGHGLSNALDTLVDTAVLMQNEPVAFVLVGQGPEKAALHEKAEQCGLRNIHFLPPVPKLSIPALLREMDVLYLGWRSEPLYRFGISPNKLLDYMMSAKPVLHANPAPNDSVTECGCGISVPPENPAANADAIRKFMRASTAEKVAMGQRGKAYVLAHHDYRRLAEGFLESVG